MTTIPVMTREYFDQRRRREQSAVAELWDLLDRVRDPELPVLSIWDLGVLRDVVQEKGTVVVTITPTYSGCPAMETIRSDIEQVLGEAGVAPLEVRTQLAPAWSSTWLSPEGCAKLRDYGIAPPQDGEADGDGLTPDAGVVCPHCGSNGTRRISEFGSTACKALFQCNDCSEPFDYFKRI